MNLGVGELVVLVILGLLIFGPEQLPKVAADAARMVREVRRMASGARQELSEALGPELSELGDLNDFKELKELGNLNPRTFVKRNLLDLVNDDGSADGASQVTDNAARERAPKPPPSAQGFDDDTT